MIHPKSVPSAQCKKVALDRERQIKKCKQRHRQYEKVRHRRRVRETGEEIAKTRE